MLEREKMKMFHKDIRLFYGDCCQVMKKLNNDSIDAVVTDPPYELGFMGKKWDSTGISFQLEVWQEVLRILKPGGHLLAMGGTRTHHRLMCALEDAGFEIRDTLMWLYGSGFPKSLDVSKAIDKAAGAERADLGASPNWRESKRDREKFGSMEVRGANAGRITIPATDAAREWDGWGTALKPAWEPIVLARKPLIGTLAATVQEHGTGALNVDGCRVGAVAGQGGGAKAAAESMKGRWPANLMLDKDAAAMLDAQSGELTSGGASRFFYCAKASRKERGKKNNHPTVKPIALMCYLVRLITPPRGIILDPFIGSGTTALAALDENFRCIGIDNNKDYLEIVQQRVEEREEDDA